MPQVGRRVLRLTPLPRFISLISPLRRHVVLAAIRSQRDARVTRSEFGVALFP